MAYSIDAGYHVFLFTLAANVETVKAKIAECPAVADNLERIIETDVDPEGIEPVLL